MQNRGGRVVPDWVTSQPLKFQSPSIDHGFKCPTPTEISERTESIKYSVKMLKPLSSIGLAFVSLVPNIR